MPPSTSQWLFYAITSGACAALNGVFAKLTTTELTTTWSTHLTNALHISPDYAVFSDYTVRAFFLAMNLLFNGIMWTLFTRALTTSSSTVRVSVINTSANFILTALFGAGIFEERLPGMWWVGAALLVAGSVVIGQRDGEGESGKEAEARGSGKRDDGVVAVDGKAEVVDVTGAEKTSEVETRKRG